MRLLRFTQAGFRRQMALVQYADSYCLCVLSKSSMGSWGNYAEESVSGHLGRRRAAYMQAWRDWDAKKTSSRCSLYGDEDEDAKGDERAAY